MKAKLTAGAELDLLNRDELMEVLRSWGHELTRGPRFRRRSFLGTVNGAGDLLIDHPESGPAEGMVWAITRVTVAGIDPATESVDLYANSAEASNLLLVGVTQHQFPGDHGVILVSGDQLVIAGSSLTPAGQVAVTVQIKEVPALMAWSL